MDRAEPTLFVILGGTGDLARRKLLPALVRARAQGYLGKPSVIVGVARDSTVHDDAGFRSWTREGLIDVGLMMDEETDRWLNECVYFQPLGAGHATDYQILAKRGSQPWSSNTRCRATGSCIGRCRRRSFPVSSKRLHP